MRSFLSHGPFFPYILHSSIFYVKTEIFKLVQVKTFLRLVSTYYREMARANIRVHTRSEQKRVQKDRILACVSQCMQGELYLHLRTPFYARC